MSTPDQPQPTSLTVAEFRRRLQLVAWALLLAQFLYIVMAFAMIFHGFRPARPGSEERNVVVLTVLGVSVISVGLSFVVVTAKARREPAVDFATGAKALVAQFFLGFALSEVPSLGGLLLFVLYAHAVALVAMVSVSVAAIAGHYARVRKRLELLGQLKP